MSRYVFITSIIVILLLGAGAVYCAQAGSVDQLLRLEQYRGTTPDQPWPADGSIKAYA